MKLQGIGTRSCYFNNTIRGTWETLKPGQVIELDLKKDAQQIFELISGHRAVPVDSGLVPDKGKYKVIHSFSYKEADRNTIYAKLGSFVTLDRIQGTEFMVKNFVRPSNPDAWIPGDLISPRAPITDEVKVMFDKNETKPAESWITRGIKR